ncbi:putative 2-oxoglutarate-dependent dioxygenase AOP1.2 [Glycine max]|nr:putative 2-oxoglutarate-dependent dioxygenase AOP1.2 [Glycine max]
MAIDNPLNDKDCHKYTTNMWPQGNDQFSESVNSYANEVVELDYLVKRMAFQSYGLDNKKCNSLLESTDYVLRCYKYRTPKKGETNLGVRPHTDSGFLTILNQKLNSLKIQLKDGEWFKVDASPNMLAVLASDAFMVVWSNDRIRGCVHQVFMNSKVDRYCLALLSYAGKVMEPEEKLEDEKHPLRYKPFDHYGYLRFFLTEEAVKSAFRIKSRIGSSRTRTLSLLHSLSVPFFFFSFSLRLWEAGMKCELLSPEGVGRRGQPWWWCSVIDGSGALVVVSLKKGEKGDTVTFFLSHHHNRRKLSLSSEMKRKNSQELHVVDFTDENTKKPGTDAWLSACSVVRTALEDNGFFMARYDKVGKELCDSVVSAVEELFDLPVETKAQKTSEKLFHGYLGQVSWLPLYESVGIDDPLTLLGESINEYSKLLGELDHMAKRMVFESYGVDMQRCDSFIESNDYLLRCMMYRTPQTGEIDLGLQPHSDLTITSIVHQLNNLNGLEIKLKDGEWKGIDASPSSFVVMAGDAFNVWSNGRIRPCEHRVTMNAKKTRYSMGLFSFGGNKVMRIPEELVNKQHPLRYKPLFDHYEYLRFYDKEKIKEPYSRIQAHCGISTLQ